jgi:hypothetical protein
MALILSLGAGLLSVFDRLSSQLQVPSPSVAERKIEELELIKKLRECMRERFIPWEDCEAEVAKAKARLIAIV